MSRRAGVVQLVLAFVAGALAGALAVGFAARENVDRVLHQWAVLNTVEEATTLSELANGRVEATKGRLIAALPGLARHLEADPSAPFASEALWAIRLAYAETGAPVPPDLEPLLEHLDPDAAPRCRRMQERLLSGQVPPLSTE